MWRCFTPNRLPVAANAILGTVAFAFLADEVSEHLELSWLPISASEAIGVLLPSGEKRVGRLLRFGKIG
jgi:hypothetical protein